MRREAQRPPDSNAVWQAKAMVSLLFATAVFDSSATPQR